MNKIKYLFLRWYSKIYCAILGVKLGKNSVIYPTSSLRVEGGILEIGDNSTIAGGAIIKTQGGHILIGSNVTVQSYAIVYGYGGVNIGNAVRIGAQSTIISFNHIFDHRDIPIYLQGIRSLGVSIESDVWIGSGCRILDGVVVARGSIINSGSVLLQSTEVFSIYGGNPAKLLMFRPLI